MKRVFKKLVQSNVRKIYPKFHENDATFDMRNQSNQ